MSERNLIAISIKHTLYDAPGGKKWKFGMPFILWGNGRTKDEEKRSFSGYTRYLNEAELYSLLDWKNECSYLASTWAVPEIEIDCNVYECYKMQSETDGWNADTKWPQSALDILNEKSEEQHENA